ncbi:hypothetical protein ASPU41_20600 (plasmid) [Arthrobacter sp. U41]|nr:hypothetical protein ASPU41_20600 [Arthrobacter sp. U41]
MFTDQRTLQVGGLPHHRKHQIRRRGIVPVEDHPFHEELDSDALVVSLFATERKSSIFRASRSMLCKTRASSSRMKRSSSSSWGRPVYLPEESSVRMRVQLDVPELPLSILLQAADPDVSNAMPSHDDLPTKRVRLNPKTPTSSVEEPEDCPNLT